MRCMFRKEHRSAFFMLRNTNAACRSRAANVFCSTLPDRADHFVLVGFLRGADAATPHPRRPARPGAGYLRRYAGGGGQKCVKVFLQISPLFCGKICKKL